VRLASSLAALALLAVPAAADEVPFVVSPDSVTLAMLQVAKVTNEDYVIDLGSGDGRIVILAAKRFGARGLGIEINPELVAKSRENARNAGVESRVSFREQDLFKTDLSPASVVTLYLLPEVNMQLRPKLLQLRPGTRVVSHDFDMEDWEPDRKLTVEAPDKAIGLGKTSNVYFWIVPARVEGLWCGTGKAKDKSITISQRHQKVRIDVPGGDAVKALEGRINGNAILSRAKVLNLAYDGSKLRTTYAGGATAALKGATFVRAKGPSCA
jgi:Methyltransferase domain